LASFEKKKKKINFFSLTLKMVGPESPNGSTPQPAAKKYGITKPISIAGPTEADLQRNMDMEKVNF
jgi:hypothetical protein